MREFPGRPVIRTLCFHSRGPRFDRWSGNQDPASYVTALKKEKKEKKTYNNSLMCTTVSSAFRITWAVERSRVLWKRAFTYSGIKIRLSCFLNFSFNKRQCFLKKSRISSLQNNVILQKWLFIVYHVFYLNEYFLQKCVILIFIKIQHQLKKRI